MKTVLVIDGQGGGFGKALIEALRKRRVPVRIMAVGTNSIATSAMMRAGADAGATGTNPVRVNCRRADVIAGPMGIVLANSMMGEFTPEMAAAVAESDAARVLVPVTKCSTYVAGVARKTLAQYIDDAVEIICDLTGEDRPEPDENVV